MKTIIAEKPSVAREIARIVGATKREEGYFEGGGYAVTWSEVRVETKIKTVVKVDTILISAPMAVFWRFVPDDTTRIGDTLLHRRQVVYSDSSYRAVVSGYVDPRLDSMTVYPRTVYQTVTNDIYHPVVVKPKRKRWGFGLQAGYGYPGGWYVGAGVSYDLWQW